MRGKPRGKEGLREKVAGGRVKGDLREGRSQGKGEREGTLVGGRTRRGGRHCRPITKGIERRNSPVEPDQNGKKLLENKTAARILEKRRKHRLGESLLGDKTANHWVGARSKLFGEWLPEGAGCER